jgi:hypothetical protein
MRRLGLLLAVILAVLTVGAPAVAGASAPGRRVTRRRAAADDPSLTAAERLLTYVPADARSDCIRDDAQDTFGDRFASAVGAVTCPSPAKGVDSVSYILEPDTAIMGTDYLNFVGLNPPDQPATTDGCDYSHTWNYHAGGADGSVGCASAPGSNLFIWTANRQKIIGVALSNTSDSKALHTWWNKHSGPLEHAAKVSFASTVPATRAKVAKALIKQTGNATGCKQLDRTGTEFSKGSDGWRYLPWLRASLSCKAPHNQGPMQYFQTVPSVAKRFADQLKASNLNGQKPGKHAKYCDTPRNLLTKKNKVVGGLQCFYVNGLLWMRWWHTASPAPGMVGLMPGDSFTSPQKFEKFLIANHLL